MSFGRCSSSPSSKRRRFLTVGFLWLKVNMRELPTIRLSSTPFSSSRFSCRCIPTTETSNVFAIREAVPHHNFRETVKPTSWICLRECSPALDSSNISATTYRVCSTTFRGRHCAVLSQLTVLQIPSEHSYAKSVEDWTQITTALSRAG